MLYVVWHQRERQIFSAQTMDTNYTQRKLNRIWPPKNRIRIKAYHPSPIREIAWHPSFILKAQWQYTFVTLYGVY